MSIHHVEFQCSSGASPLKISKGRINYVSVEELVADSSRAAIGKGLGWLVDFCEHCTSIQMSRTLIGM